MCGGCSLAIIDEGMAPTWQMIHLDNLRLAAIADCGPAVAYKARRAVNRSTQVLQELGVRLPNDDEAQAYTASLERESPSLKHLHPTPRPRPGRRPVRETAKGRAKSSNWQSFASGTKA